MPSFMPRPAAAPKLAIKKAAAPAPTAPAANPAIAAAAKQYSGAYSGALNNVSDQERRVRDVGARRQNDAKLYAAWVMGKQGAIQAASQAADDKSLQQHVGLQAATAIAQQRLQAGLQTQRDAQAGAGVGIQGNPLAQAGMGSPYGGGPGAGAAVPGGGAGAVPAQQLSPVVDAQTRTQSLLGNVGQQQADRANTNRGKAGFLAAAAQAQLAATQRGIEGDTFNQLTTLGGQKTDLLSRRTDAAMADRRARDAAASDAANAQLAHEDRLAAIQNTAAIAGSNQDLRRELSANELGVRQREGRANRRVRLKTSATGAAALGYVSPADQRRRNTALRKVDTGTEAALTELKRQYDASPKAGPDAFTVDDARFVLGKKFKGLAPEVQDYVITRMFGGTKAKTKKGGKTAGARFAELKKRIASGEIAGG